MRILKFDHVSFVGSRREREELLLRFQPLGTIGWFEEGREILSSKRQYLIYQSAYDHDLFFFNPISVGELPVEVILYDESYDVMPHQCSVSNNIISAYYESQGANVNSQLVEAMNILGAKSDSKGTDSFRFNLAGILDKEPRWFHIDINKQKFTSPHLDQKGYGCITLLVNKIEPIANSVLTLVSQRISLCIVINIGFRLQTFLDCHVYLNCWNLSGDRSCTLYQLLEKEGISHD